MSNYYFKMYSFNEIIHGYLHPLKAFVFFEIYLFFES